MVCGKAGLYQRRESGRLVGLREDCTRVRCKGCSKGRVFPPTAQKDNRPVAADHIAQLDSLG